MKNTIFKEIFDSSELIANLDKNAVAVENSVYDHVIYDSGIENKFALALDSDPDVKMFSRFQAALRLKHRLAHIIPIGRFIWKRMANKNFILFWKPKGRIIYSYSEMKNG